MKGSLLRDRDFGSLTGAIFLSALGDFLALIPLALHIQEDTGSGIAMAAFFIALFSPPVIVSGWAGRLVDRHDSGRVMAVASLVAAAACAGLAFSDPIGLIIPLTAVLGTAVAVAQPAEFALVPVAAGKDRISDANGLVETARYLGFTVGPLLGGVLAASLGNGVPLLINAATFLVVAAVALRFFGRRRAAADDEEAGEVSAGAVRTMLRDPVLGLVLATAFVSLLFMSATIAAEVFFIVDHLDAGKTGYGAGMTAWMLGMIVGSLVVASRVPSALLATGALVAIGVQGAGLGAPTLWLSFAFLLPMWLIGGIGHGAKNVLIRTLMHERVDESAHGRAFASYNALKNSAELIAMGAGGVLVAAINARYTVMLAGALPLLTAVIALLLRGRSEPAAAGATA